MAALSLLLLVKIIGSLAAVAAPLLALSKSRLDATSGFGPSSLLLYRLYGVAILALLVGYGGGFLQVQAGDFPSGVTAMGLVSNAGAVLVMALTGRARRMVLATGFFGAIAVGLAGAAAAPDLAMAPLW